MTLERIRDLYRSRPFHPFDMYLADGRSIRVPHREFLSIGGRTVTVYDRDDIPEIVDLLLVISLKLVRSQTASGNGR